MDLDEVEIRVLGCLIEKQRTVPDSYPLSLNSLRLACNQSTNRDPVVDWDESTVRMAAQRLHRRGLARPASGHTSRASKYRHLAREALELDDAGLSVLAVLLLRGPQTPGELRARSERLHRFDDPDDLRLTLEELDERGFAASTGRQPGQKEERWTHLLGADADDAEDRGGDRPPGAQVERALSPVSPAPASPDLESRLSKLEAEVAELREALERLG